MPGHEQLLAWRIAHQFADEIDRAVRSGRFRGDGNLAAQLRRSAVSVVSNIAEGHGRGRRREFAHFLLIARGSGVEAQTQLVLALDARRLTFCEYQRLRGLADHAVALVTKLHAAVRRQAERG